MTHLILTEARDNLGIITSEFFDGFTIIPATGFWKGEKEDSVIILLQTDEHGKVVSLCKKIKEVNKQEAVLLVSFPSFERFV